MTGRLRARKRRMVGDARRVREMARRQVGRCFGRDFVAETDFRWVEGPFLLPLGVRVSLRLRRGCAMPQDLHFIFEAPLGGTWLPDGSGLYGGKQHARDELTMRLRTHDERDF